MLPNGGFKNGNYLNKIKVPQQKSKLLAVSISIVLILLIIGVGSYYYFVWKPDKNLRDLVESIGQIRQPAETLKEPQVEPTTIDETTGLTPETDTVQVFDSSEYEYSYFADIANELMLRLRQ